MKKKPMNYLFFLSMAISFTASDSLQGAILHVSGDAEIGGDGSSWEAPLSAIGEASALAGSGDQIWIKTGTYNEAIELVPGIELYGGFAGTEATDEFELRRPDLNITTIDASGLNTSVVLGASGSLLDGFTITGGVAPRGGGIACFGTAMTINHCKVVGNRAEALSGESAYGGGVYCTSAALTVTNSEFSNNRVSGAVLLNESADVGPFGGDTYDENGNLASIGLDASDEFGGFGGGLYLSGGPFVLENLDILDNRVIPDATGFVGQSRGTMGLRAKGGGVFVRGRVNVTGCEISRNEAVTESIPATAICQGGGLFVDGEGTVRRTFISMNSAGYYTSGGAHAKGGGFLVSGTGAFSNCVFSDNSVQAYAFNGGWSDFGSGGFGDGDLVFTNCTKEFDSGSFYLLGSASFTNSIVSLNSQIIPNATVKFCDVTGLLEHFPGNGNIDQEPRFVDPENDDFRLRPDSPLIDAGTDVMLSEDILGATRPVDIPGVGRDGPGAFDIGAYEFQLADLPTPTPTRTSTPTATPTPTFEDLIGDIDENEDLNELDLLLLAMDWHRVDVGEATSQWGMKTNLNDDNRVDSLDVLIFLNDWLRNH
ncbi:MAG: hypothetical protein KC944_19485 [Candidatus Omnitrophica bacterium]|nr:hypothetical protein [Candidatus Omnitrophota bacterium]